LGLKADVQNSDSIEGAQILVGEEVRSSPATVAEARERCEELDKAVVDGGE
jgi:hypothetical protein